MPELLKIASKFTINELLSRDSFQQRMDTNQSIGSHEIMVPILQGIDSVELKADIEIGGTDQLFNFNFTRKIQQLFNQDPEVCFMMPIINGTDGRKMSKSFGNCIFINDIPEDVFGKVMSISDDVMKQWWSFFIEDEIGEPFTSKKRLAFAITKEIWGEGKAESARKHFQAIIQSKGIPENIQEVELNNIIDIITNARNISKSEALRLLRGNGVKVNGQVVNETFELNLGDIVKIGKRDFVKIK